MDIRAGDFSNDQVRELLSFHFRSMHENSPPGTAYVLDLSGLQAPGITFLTAWEGGTLLGCGALKELSATEGEIKSMRTHPDHLRKGAAAQLLDAIIENARQRKYVGLSLETGNGPAFEAALTLYRRYGFVGGGAFGGYTPSDFNQFFHLTLSPAPTSPAA